MKRHAGQTRMNLEDISSNGTTKQTNNIGLIAVGLTGQFLFIIILYEKKYCEIIMNKGTNYFI